MRINQADDNLCHHVLLVWLALGDHECQCHKRIVRELARSVRAVEDRILLQEPDKEEGCDTFVAVRKRMILDDEVQEVGRLLRSPWIASMAVS